MGFVLTIWFFVTPICYPAESLPQQWLWLFRKNPMYEVVEAYRAVLLEGTAPAWPPLVKLWVLALVVFWLGFAWFYKTRKSFAEMI
jgi:lipopolysaccharide transport system permease protein